jgi:hypothetical protein
MISTLLRFIYEFMSMRRYSALGLYITIGLYWLFPSTAIEKSDMALIRFELLPMLVNASSFDPMFLGRDVCVVLMGRRADVNMIDATGFQIAILDTS